MKFFAGIVIQYLIWLVIFSIPASNNETIFEKSQAILFNNPIADSIKTTLTDLFGMPDNSSSDP